MCLCVERENNKLNTAVCEKPDADEKIRKKVQRVVASEKVRIGDNISIQLRLPSSILVYLPFPP